MGLNSRGGNSSKTFLSVFDSSLVLQYDNREDLEKKLDAIGLEHDAIKVRQKTKGKNEGKDVYYFKLHDVSGMLTDVILKDTDWGEVLELEITDVDEKYQVSLGEVFGRIPRDFIRRVANIDVETELTFGVWGMVSKDNGKPYSGVVMYQNEEKLPYVLERDDLPEATSKTRGKVTKWDFSAQEDFLYEKLGEFLAENFAGEAKDGDESKPEPRKARGKKLEDMPDDDMPF
jgi:hypothetical protein